MTNEGEEGLTSLQSVRRHRRTPGKGGDSWTGGRQTLKGVPCLLGMLNFYIKKAIKN